MDIEYSHKSAKHKTRRPRTHLEEPQETLDSLSPENVINGLTLAQNRMIGLQQTAGNQAVLHHMVQRQTPHLSQPQAPTPTTAAAPATAPQAPAENQMAYTIDLQLPGGARRHFERLPRDRALRELYWIAVQVGGFINTWRDSHVQMEQQFHESWLVGRVSDWLSFHERPPISIWQEPLATWARAHSQVSQGNIREATEALRTAVEQANRANHQVEDYREAAITGEHSGAQRAIIGLEVSEVVLAAIATAATAGAAGAAFAAAAGTAGAATAGATAVAGATVAAAATASTAAMVGTVAVSSAVAGVTAGAYGMIMSESGQISEHVLGLRRNFDFEAVWRRGEHDAILGFVGGIIGGGLNVALSRVATGYILANESMIVHFAEANFMDGEALFQFIYRSGPGLFSEFISFIPSNVLNTYVSNVVTGAVGDESARRQLDQESFCHQTWMQMVQGGIINMFVSFVTHRMTTVGAGLTGQAPAETPAPSARLALPEPAQTGAATEPAPTGRSSQTSVDPLAATQAGPQAPVDPLSATQASPQAPVNPLAATQAGSQAPVDPLLATQAGPQAPLDPLAATQAGSQAPANPLAATQPGGRGVSPVARPVQQPGPISYEQARGALARLNLSLRQGNYVPREVNVGFTSDWEIYAANYQIVAGRGVPPPPHGWVGPNGMTNLYTPNGIDLLGPNEAPPPLPPSCQAVDPLAVTQAGPQLPVDPLGATQAGRQAPVNPLAVTQPGGRGVSPVAGPVQQPGPISYEQAQGALARLNLSLRQGNYVPREVNVGFTSDWEIYVANYQIVAGRGVPPPPHGWVGPNGMTNLYTPNGIDLLGPNEAPPPLPPSCQAAGSPAGAGASGPVSSGSVSP